MPICDVLLLMLQCLRAPRKTVHVDKPQQLVWYETDRTGIITDLGKIVMGPDLHRVEWPCARKRHKCCECGHPIKKGDRYELVTGLWDGDLWCRFKTCADCADMRSYVVRHYQDGIPFGELQEHLAQEVEEGLYDQWQDIETSDV